MKTENKKYKDSASRAQKCACTNSAEALPILERKFKDSGIPWIGEIPEDWSVEPIKHKYKIVAGSTPKSDNIENWDGNISWITPADYKTEQIYVYRGKRNLSQKGYESCSAILLPPGCLIFSKRAPIGLVAINSLELCTNQGCLGCIPNNDVNTKFVYYSTSIFSEQFELYGSGTTFKEISANNFANFRLALPPLPTQQRIADFLDRKCAEIDELAALQETMNAELKRYKQSVITEAVTKGLDKNVKMKDSGVEWIGEIPEGWEVRRIKNIGHSQNGLTYSPIDMVSENEGTLVIRASNVQNGKLTFDDNVYVSSLVPSSLMVKKGDLIICSRNGSAALVGKCAMVEDDINATYGAFMMRFQSVFYGRYIYYLLSSAITQYKQLFFTTTINQLTVGTFSGLRVPFVMSTDEQQSIADYLDQKCGEIDELIAIKQQKIEQLKEYKKSVIFEYVTGKKEVER